MPSDLFGDVVRSRISLGNRSRYTVPLSLLAHVAAIVPLVLVPLLATDALPSLRDIDAFVVSAPTPPEPPPPARPVEAVKPASNPDAAPAEAPNTIAPEPQSEPMLSDPVPPGVPGGIVPGGGTVITAEPVAPAQPPIPPQPVRLHTGIRTPTKVHDVAPAYSAIAQAARVQGTVIMEATIDTDGRIQNVRVLRSIPLLDQSALEAVRQWQYTPTLLNGVAVPVIMTVTVTFTLTK